MLRVPGGEITPAQLIAIGEVARDFGLSAIAGPAAAGIPVTLRNR